MQTVSLIDIRNVEKREESLEIKIPDRIKTSGINKKQPFLILPFYKGDQSICAASALECYLERTKKIRGAENSLFIGHRKPHKAVTAQTLCLRVKNMLDKSGLDIKMFMAHSTRHASTSAARRKGVNINSIRQSRTRELKKKKSFLLYTHKQLH